MPDNPTPYAYPELPPQPQETLPVPGRPPGVWVPLSVTSQELESAALTDKHIQSIVTSIEKDKEYVASLSKYMRYELKPLLYRTQMAMRRARDRIAGRERQLKHFRKLLKHKLAYEKIKQVREELNINL